MTFFSLILKSSISNKTVRMLINTKITTIAKIEALVFVCNKERIFLNHIQFGGNC